METMIISTTSFMQMERHPIGFDWIWNPANRLALENFGQGKLVVRTKQMTWKYGWETAPRHLMHLGM